MAKSDWIDMPVSDLEDIADGLHEVQTMMCWGDRPYAQIHKITTAIRVIQSLIEEAQE